jgi:hypothetical protein
MNTNQRLRNTFLLLLIVLLLMILCPFRLMAGTIINNTFKISRESGIDVRGDNFEIRGWSEAMFIPPDATDSAHLFRTFTMTFNNQYLVSNKEPRDLMRGEEFVVFDRGLKCTATIVDFYTTSWTYPGTSTTEHFFQWVAIRFIVEGEEGGREHQDDRDKGYGR